MILISCGTTLIPFPRLLEASFTVFKKTKEEVYIQVGSTPVPSFLTIPPFHTLDFISNSDMKNKIKNARLVICAAGEAGVYQTLQYAAYKPILFPRLKKYHEHVDDQQLEIARYFESKKLVYCAEDDIQLINILKKKKFEKNVFLKQKANTQMINRLIEFTEQFK